MKILILGAGGIGGYFGGRLAQAGADVTFLVRDNRKRQLEAQGLRIESGFGNATIPVTAKLASEIKPEYDLIIFTCKAYDLPTAIEAIAPAMSETTNVLPLLNGVSHIDRLNKQFGKSRVWGGTAKIAVTLTPDGLIRHLNEWQAIAFGPQEGGDSAKVQALKQLLEKGGVQATVSPDIKRDLWLKLVHLATVATLTSLMRANVGEIVRTPDGKDLFRKVLDANIDLASREGVVPDDVFVASYRDLFSQSNSTYEASLQRDIERGGKIESDHILGFVLDRFRAHGMPHEIQLAAYTHAKAYEQRREANRLPSQLASQSSPA